MGKLKDRDVKKEYDLWLAKSKTYENQFNT